MPKLTSEFFFERLQMLNVPCVLQFRGIANRENGTPHFAYVIQHDNMETTMIRISDKYTDKIRDLTQEDAITLWGMEPTHPYIFRVDAGRFIVAPSNYDAGRETENIKGEILALSLLDSDDDKSFQASELPILKTTGSFIDIMAKPKITEWTHAVPHSQGRNSGIYHAVREYANSNVELTPSLAILAQLTPDNACLLRLAYPSIDLRERS